MTRGEQKPRTTGLAPEQVLGKAYDAQLMGRVWRFVKPHWKLLALAFLLIPVTIGFELAQPYLLKIAIDAHIAAHKAQGLGLLAGGYVLLVALTAFGNFGQLYSLQLLGQRSMHDLRQQTYRHVVTRRTAFYDRVPVGRLLTRMTNDVENINEMFASGVVTLAADLVKLIAIVVMMLALNVRLALITFTTLPLLVILVGWARRIMRDSFRLIRVKLAAMNAFVAEHISGIKVVQLFTREDRARSEYNELGLDYRNAYLGAIKADATLYAMVEAIGVASGALIAWYAGANIGEAGLTVGLVVAFVEYVNKFFIPVRDLSAKYTVMQSAMAAAERIFALLDTDEPDAPPREGESAPARADGGAAEIFDPKAPALELRDVQFAYREGEPVLRGVTLQVPRGKTIAVVGATGSGKSTLIRLLARLYEPQSGEVLVGGRDVRDWPITDLRRALTVISQDVFLFKGTVAENIRLGKLDATADEIDAALRRVGADRIIERRGGVDLELSEGAQNFSSGERQLLAFARALVRNPEILILDEATAHVDPETEAAIEGALETLIEGRTTLVIAHRLSTIRRADEIIVMSRGRLAEKGHRDELLAQGGLYARLEQTFLRQ